MGSFGAARVDISIHAPRTGSDGHGTICTWISLNFNPRSPYGERPGADPGAGGAGDISIHAPRTGSDWQFWRAKWCRWIFQSTLPVRGATSFVSTCPDGTDISIHAPRTGSDYPVQPLRVGRGYFNPRSPYGERRPAGQGCDPAVPFQSTLPVRGATFPERYWLIAALISIHAPRTGSDLPPFRGRSSGNNFNPRSPYGERRFHWFHSCSSKDFNPRSPYGERPTSS